MNPTTCENHNECTEKSVIQKGEHLEIVLLHQHAVQQSCNVYSWKYHISL